MDANITTMIAIKKSKNSNSSYLFEDPILGWAGNENSKKRFKSKYDLWTLQSTFKWANKEINKQLSDVDVDGYAATLQRMEDKVTATEAEADAYQEINDENKSEDEIIEAALAGDSDTADEDLFKKFMEDTNKAEA